MCAIHIVPKQFDRKEKIKGKAKKNSLILTKPSVRGNTIAQTDEHGSSNIKVLGLIHRECKN